MRNYSIFKALAQKAKLTNDSYDIKHALDYGISNGISVQKIREALR